MISQFSRKSRRTGIALRTEQEEQLLEALSQARAQYPWTTELGRRNRLGGDYAVMFNEASLYSFAQEEEQFDRQFLTQAEQILSPEQCAFAAQSGAQTRELAA